MVEEKSSTKNTAQRVGDLLLKAGKISANDVERITSFQKEQKLLFGRAAISLGLIREEDLQVALAEQFAYPCLLSGETSLSQELVAAFQPFSPQVEAIRAIREQLLQCRLADSVKSVALVSPGLDEGCSYVAANLAIVFSQLGENTLLIDANLRQPKQQSFFNSGSALGLSDVLSGRSDLSVIHRSAEFPTLSILYAGTIPPNPVELLSRGLKSCLQQVESEYDLVIIDTPAAELGIDAQLIAANSGNALLIARKNQTSLAALSQLKDAIQDSGSRCIGSVMTDF